MIERRFERRPARRIGVRVRIRDGAAHASTTRNVTENGAFIETDRVEVGAAGVVWVDLPDPAAEGGWNTVAAVVVHRHTDGIGVMFSHPYSALDASGTPARRAA
ncbi:MAG: PilZ domain-containing protein [Gammaproteobacteria bacterium]|jgi:hypothetical protein|nr:PilZ domain-containing protein [Gammaproteobacteria bacterium]